MAASHVELQLLPAGEQEGSRQPYRTAVQQVAGGGVGAHRERLGSQAAEITDMQRRASFSSGGCHSTAKRSGAQRSVAHNMAVCGAAVPSTVRMEPGLLTSWRICARVRG